MRRTYKKPDPYKHKLRRAKREFKEASERYYHELHKYGKDWLFGFDEELTIIK